MAYKVIILYRLYMPSYFLGTFTEYPKARCSGFMQTFRNECSTLEFQSLEFLRFCKFLLFSKPLRD